MKQINLLKLSGCSIFKQLQIEEALLRADDRNWCITNSGSAPAIVLGISCKPEEWVVGNPKIPVIKRFSGGGTVVVDEETQFITVICNEEDAGIKSFPQQVLNWNGALFEPLLSPYGFLAKENDYTLSGKKFGGNAQYIRKKRWLHHTTLLWDYEPERMKLLKHPPKMPSYRKNRSHDDFLCRLKDFIDKKETVEKAVLDVLRQKFEVTLADQEELNAILSRPHRKSTTLAI